MSYQSRLQKILSVLILFALVFSFAGHPNSVAKADPDAPLPFLDDFQSGIPSGFVSFNGGASSATLGTASDNLPVIPAQNGTTVATLSYNVGDYAGVTRDFASALDLSGYTHLRFWFKGGNTGAAMRVELKSLGANANDSVRFEYGFTDNFTDWRYFSIPWTSFSIRNDYNPGRDSFGLGSTLDLTQIWGYSILIPSGATGSFSMDEVSVTGFGTMVNFESGLPSGFGAFAGGGSSVPFATATDSLPAVPAQDNTTVAKVTSYTITDYGGTTYPFAAEEDWSHYQGLSFWYKGGNTGAMRIELKSRGPDAANSDLFAYSFTDDFTDWRFFNIPWASFIKRTDFNPGTALGNTVDASVIWGYSTLAPNGTGLSYSMDDIAPYGGGGIIVPRAKFSASTYSVNESAGTATITVNLSSATTVATTVDYATSDGSAVAGTDYTATSGTLSFNPGDTTKTFTVSITDNLVYNVSKTVNLALTNPSAATLGTPNTAVLTITDNEIPPTAPKIIDDFEADALGSVCGPVWFCVDDGGSASGSVVAASDLKNVGSGTNQALSISYSSASWGGLVGHNLSPTQDWSAYSGISFWFKGSSSGNTFNFVIDQGTGKYQASFIDDASGWKYIKLPWEKFGFREATADGMPLTTVRAYMIIFQGGTSGTFLLDQVKAFKTVTSSVDNFEAAALGGVCGPVWFCVDDGGSASASVVAANDLKNVGSGTNQALSISYTSTSWGGLVGHNLSPTQDWSASDGVSFWFKGSSSGNTFNFVIDQGTGKYQASFIDDASGWKQVVLPWAKFAFREATADGMPLTTVRAYMIIFQSGTSGTFLIDQVKTFSTTTTSVDNFEANALGGVCGPVWFCVDDGGSASGSVVAANDLKNVGSGTNQALSISYSSASWGGLVGHNLSPTQDWSASDGVGFWFEGSSSGNTFNFVIDQGTGKYQASFIDDASGWKYVKLPWEKFAFREATADGMPLTTVRAYMIIFQSGTSGTFLIDQVGIFGPAGTYYVDGMIPQIAGTIIPSAKFSASTFSAGENDGTATITVKLSVAATSAVTVDYATTTGGTAVAGTDYTAVSGTLNFGIGVTTQTFTVPVTDNLVYNAPKTVNMTISNPTVATLGTPNTAVLSIMDNETPPDTKIVSDYSTGANILYNAFGTGINFATWGSESGNVQLSTVTVPDTDLLAVPGQVGSKSLLQINYNIGAWGGFTDALADGNDWVSQDWSRYDGVSFWAYGNNTGGTIQTEIFDNQQLGNAGDSAERWFYRFDDNYSGWKKFSVPFSAFQRRTDFQPGGAPNDGLNLTDVSGYSFGMPAGTGAKTAYLADYSLYGDLSSHPLVSRVESSAYAYGAVEGDPIAVKVSLNEASLSTVTVDYAVTAGTATAGINYDDSNATGTLTFNPGETSKVVNIQTMQDGKIKPTLTMNFTLSNPSGAAMGWKSWASLGILNTTTPDASMIDDFENNLPVPTRLFSTPADSIALSHEEILSSSPDAILGQFPSNFVLTGTYPSASSLTRLFDTGRDLSSYNALRFWYKGSNSGQAVKVKLLDGQADATPAQWTQVWSDEFDGTAGTAPDPTFWNHDTGGGGFGNNEWEYYTNSTDNAAVDGTGNLVITAKSNSDSGLQCTYGPGTSTGNPPLQQCAYTSARLLTKDKIDFAYGRVEARIKIPYGQGIWPAFWMLGSDIDSNPWPGSGEIDIMENIGKASEQTRLYGTMHGPGYSGGSGIGSGPYETGSTLHDAFHTYAVEWEPTAVRWYFDGINYFTATPAQVPAGKQWVFNKPFFILMNVAVGGGWPGNPDGTTSFPQTMTVDYVRVSQGPDVAQRFESSFVDDSTAWKQVTLPYADFVSSASQPGGAASNAHPLLTHARGYGFEFPSASGTFKLDDVRGAVVSAATATPTPTRTRTPTVPPATATPTITPTATPAPGTVTLISIAQQDGTILESSEHSNKGGTLNNLGRTFNLGDDAGRKQYRGILSFNTSSIPDNATITSVILKVKRQSIFGGGNPVSIFQGFMADIKKGLFGTSALELADFRTAANGVYGPFSGVLANDVYTLNLTAGKNNINKLAVSNGLTQIRLRFKLDDNNNMLANYLSLYSGNAASVDRPQLVITYTIP